MHGDEDKKEILKLYQGLIHSCKPFLKRGDVTLLRKAFDLTLRAYSEKKLVSGVPYLNHPIAVARIVADELGLGTVSVICALLHDVIKDEVATAEDIERDFGPEFRSIVEGLTKISQLQTLKTDLHSENFVKLVLSLSDDVRIILIKLADRLHRLRTIETLDSGEKKKIANETFHLYAPIAHRLGIYNLKSEFEDLSMKYSNPDIYNAIAGKRQEIREQQMKYIEQFIQPIRSGLSRQGIDCDIKGREKSVFSIWNKMKKQNVEFEEVYDLFAIRIILRGNPDNEKSECWKVYSIVTDIYQPNPLRLRDWITTPKPSGYESLHTTVIGPNGKWVEVQIRTGRMDEIAEKGLAAHWKYKEGKTGQDASHWLRNIRETLDNPAFDKSGSSQKSKMELYSDKIFVFTPKGDLKKLPAGSTVLDFAFEVHTNVGATCTGARVNDRIVQIRHVLQNGDRVEVLTSKNQKPNRDWLSIARSPRVKARIRRALDEQMYKEAEAGKETFLRKLKNWKVTNTDEVTEKLIRFFKLRSAVDLFYLIATGKIETTRIREIIAAEFKTETPRPPEVPATEETAPTIKSEPEKGEDFLIIDDHLINVIYRLAKCCNPIFGDEILGFVTIGKGISIHRDNCPNARQMAKNYEYRIVNVRWKKSTDNPSFQAQIRVVGLDEVGVLSSIIELIAGLKISLRSYQVDNKEGIFESTMRVLVKDTRQLDGLIHSLLRLKGIVKANRIEVHHTH